MAKLHRSQSDHDEQKQKLLRMIAHPSTFVKEHAVNVYAEDCAQLSVTFYISREAYDAKDAPTDELSETPDPGTEFYRGLANHQR